MEQIKKDKPNKPSDTAFKQQRLQGWSCSPSSNTLGIIYIIIGIAFILIGVIILIESNKIIEATKRYDDITDCKADWKNPNTCTISISITEKMDSPVFFYFEIRNMYQNHRKYNKSRDINQLMGDTRSISEIDSYCDPIVDMEDLGFETTLNLTESDPANPCGLVAKSYFNDTFELYTSNELKKIQITSKDIAWDIDKEEKFKKNSNSEELQWIDVENGNN